MIVPMKKVSLIIRGDRKQETLSALRKLGIVHIQALEGAGKRLEELKERKAVLESALFSVSDKKNKKAEPQEISVSQAISAAVPAKYTAAIALSIAVLSPDAVSAVISPVNTSPLPPFACPALPAVLIYAVLPSVISVEALFTTKTILFSLANFFATDKRSFISPFSPSSLFNSPICGVRTTSHFLSASNLFLSSSSSPARAFKPSASITSLPV